MSRRDHKEMVKAEVAALVERQGGSVSPRAIVEAARDPSSVLHGEFEWDDTAAAEGFRIMQAAALLRSIKIKVVTESKDPTRVNLVVQRAYPSLPSLRGSERGSYVPIARIEDPSELVNEVLVQLERLRQKHANLSQLSGVWRAVDEARAAG